MLRGFMIIIKER